MALHIEQTSLYQGENWWKWSVWLEGNEAELDRVASVTYVLHPTFNNPVRTITSRKDKFRLDSAGWGTFLIQASVKLMDEHVEHLKHDLQLFYDDGTATNA
jgi:transcription initiation factor IIF auxiliary subunit